ncbi:uncharacterized protein LOC141614599 [Silene latifolia]|uniref:uncharacterized protein LOC141614599 n=1 Tax=Silene latifolia TaxID=37657 RepID=UPI003D78AFB8
MSYFEGEIPPTRFFRYWSQMVASATRAHDIRKGNEGKESKTGNVEDTNSGELVMIRDSYPFYFVGRTRECDKIRVKVDASWHGTYDASIGWVAYNGMGARVFKGGVKMKAESALQTEALGLKLVMMWARERGFEKQNHLISGLMEDMYKISTSKPGDPEYIAGVKEFINFAVENSKGRTRLPCPCFKCHKFLHKKVDEILNHLRKYAFDRTYTVWIWHGEDKEKTHTDNVHENRTINEGHRIEDMLREVQDKFDENPATFEALLGDSEKPLYTGCKKYTRLSSVLRLYNLKASHGLSDTGFTELLEIVKDMLPDDNVFPSRTYEAKKILCSMSLPYEKIHACRNDCVLFRNEYVLLKNCPTCNVSRYKKEGVTAKVLWYFPIIPRFHRLFLNARDAELLLWHHFERIKDDKLRHPADSPHWRFIDGKFPEFGKEVRNLRLALSTDGMNPFRSLSTTYSTWPVILVTYNLPPWLCMKRKYMLFLLISGPKQPGNDIDVYLAPLIDELKFLWETGEQVYDAYRKETFNLRAMLFCTIQDYPAYGNLSGYTVKGKAPCPICEDGTTRKWLKSSRKNIYLDNRRFLLYGHSYRKLKRAFNGEQENKGRPRVLTGVEVFEKVKNIQTVFGKTNGSILPKQGYKKCSVFWRLPYWRFLFVRHSLDVMHIEKNVCDSLVGTLLNIPGKTKDGVSARDDLKELGIRKELHIVERNNKIFLPPAAYTLSRKEKKEFCECLAGVKVPEGYSSNIKSLVSMENLKLVGLKSHDCHVLMQHLIQWQFAPFYLKIKVIDPKDLDSLESSIVVILCQLEMYFPPSFFDVMIHLTVHLVREVRFCGPVYLRNQYPFEREMKTYKGYVKNHFRPEGCIAERVLCEDAVKYNSEFLGNAKTIGLPISRHTGRINGKGTLGRKELDLSYEKWHKAHTYILFNEDEVTPYIHKHIAFLREKHRRASEKSLLSEHSKTFNTWLKDTVTRKLEDSTHLISDRLKSLAYGPNFNASFYSGYVINGCTFYTREQDENSIMQNSRVTVEAEAMHFASAKDKNLVCGKMIYYGVIQEIIKLHYSAFSIPVFRCDWVDSHVGVEYEELGFTLVNLHKHGHNEDPYILASQVKQVFYVTDPADKRRSVVITPRARHEIDDYDKDGEVEERAATKNFQNQNTIDDEAEDSLTYVREDHDEGEWIDNSNKMGRYRDGLIGFFVGLQI